MRLFGVGCFIIVLFWIWTVGLRFDLWWFRCFVLAGVALLWFVACGLLCLAGLRFSNCFWRVCLC